MQINLYSGVNITRKEIYDKSIVVMGAVGVGKHTISKELAHKLGLPIINTTILKHCPKDIEELKKRKKSIIKQLKYLEYTLNKGKFNKTKLFCKITELKRLKNTLIQQISMRKTFPDMPTYEDLGYEQNIYEYLTKKLGPIAGHYYQKQFDSQFLNILVKQITTPSVVNLDSFIPVSLDKHYPAIKEQIISLCPSIFYDKFNEEYIGYGKTSKVIHKFRNVFYYKLPNDYKISFPDALSSQLNDELINSKQYEKLATNTIKLGTTNSLGEHIDISLNEAISKTLKMYNLLSNTKY